MLKDLQETVLHLCFTSNKHTDDTKQDGRDFFTFSDNSEMIIIETCPDTVEALFFNTFVNKSNR